MAKHKTRRQRKAAQSGTPKPTAQPTTEGPAAQGALAQAYNRIKLSTQTSHSVQPKPFDEFVKELNSLIDDFNRILKDDEELVTLLEGSAIPSEPPPGLKTLWEDIKESDVYILDRMLTGARKLEQMTADLRAAPRCTVLSAKFIADITDLAEALDELKEIKIQRGKVQIRLAAEMFRMARHHGLDPQRDFGLSYGCPPAPEAVAGAKVKDQRNAFEAKWTAAENGVDVDEQGRKAWGLPDEFWNS